MELATDFERIRHCFKYKVAEVRDYIRSLRNKGLDHGTYHRQLDEYKKLIDFYGIQKMYQDEFKRKWKKEIKKC